MTNKVSSVAVTIPPIISDETDNDGDGHIVAQQVDQPGTAGQSHRHELAAEVPGWVERARCGEGERLEQSAFLCL